MSIKPLTPLFPLRRVRPWTSALAMGLAADPAGAQQPVAVPYTPPAVIVITPPASAPAQNPYLIYVPMVQPAPQGFVPVVPVAPAAAPITQAAEKPTQGPSLSDLGKALSNYFTPEEQDLLVDYMKESVLAAFKGEEVFLPPDLAFKLEILLQRMKKEGILYMDNLMQQLEHDLKNSLKEQFGKPEPTPQQPAKLPQTTPASSPAAPPAPAPNGASKWLPPGALEWLSQFK